MCVVLQSAFGAVQSEQATASILSCTAWLCAFLQTNCCVESTMRAAYEAGFKVFTLTDCCAATR
jgi:hypothetical protein